MIDREKVIGLLQEMSEYFRECRSNASFASKAENHFWELQNAANEAVELLKEHEPVKPEYKLIPGSATIHEWECGNCGYSLFMILSHENRYSAKSVVRYCAGCGRSVKWDDNI